MSISFFLEKSPALFSAILSEGLSTPLEWIEFASLLIELLAVAIIVGSVFYSSAHFLYALIARKNPRTIIIIVTNITSGDRCCWGLKSWWRRTWCAPSHLNLP